MSSLRNAIPRRDHKERHQPNRRREKGLLEKKKDYKVRAKNYKRQRNTLRKLKEKAAFRNPDEFYFKMINTKREGGVHKVDNTPKYTPMQLIEMKTQDMGYLVLKKNIESKKVAKIQSNLHLIDETVKADRKHTIFVDETEEVESFDPATFFETTPEFVERTYNRPLRSALKQEPINANQVTQQDIGKLAGERARTYRELNLRMERDDLLKEVIGKMYLQKQRMKNKVSSKVAKRGNARMR